MTCYRAAASVGVIAIAIALTGACSAKPSVVTPAVTFHWTDTHEQLRKPSVEILLDGRKETVRLEEADTPAFQNRIEWLRGRSAALGVDVRAVRMGEDIRAIYFLPSGRISSQFISGGRVVGEFTQDASSALRCLITGPQELERGDPRQPRRVSVASARPSRAGNGLGGLHTTYTIAPILTGPLAAEIAGTYSPIPPDTLRLFVHALINGANKILQEEIAVTLVPFEMKDAYPGDANQNNFIGSADGLAIKGAKIATTGANLAHTIGLGSGPSGWAQIASACGTDWAKGATVGKGNEPGAFLDTFIHEVGHQLGAHHSFNGKGRSEFNVGYEPGAGTTVMTYQVSLQSFHAASLTQIFTYLNAQSCGTTVSVPLPPTLSAKPPAPRPVPIATAFTLDAEPDSTATCVRIDEFDPGTAEDSTPPFFAADTGCESVRSFPDEPRGIDLSTLASAMPRTKSSLHFRALAWSGRNGPRPLASSDINVDVIDSAPFVVRSVVPGCHFAFGTKFRADWDSSGILPAPMNAKKLTAELIYEAATSKPTLLAKDIPASANSGVFDLPPLTGRARLKLTPVDGVYFAVSDWFTVQPAAACPTTAVAPE